MATSSELVAESECGLRSNFRDSCKLVVVELRSELIIHVAANVELVDEIPYTTRPRQMRAVEHALNHAMWVILGSRQNPKIVMCDDPEVVGHLIAERFPVFGQGFSKEPQDRISKLLLRWIVAIVSDVLVHNRP